MVAKWFSRMDERFEDVDVKFSDLPFINSLIYAIGLLSIFVILNRADESSLLQINVHDIIAWAEITIPLKDLLVIIKLKICHTEIKLMLPLMVITTLLITE